MLKGFLVGAVIGTVISVTGLLGTSYFLGQDTGGVVEQAKRPHALIQWSPPPQILPLLPRQSLNRSQNHSQSLSLSLSRNQNPSQNAWFCQQSRQMPLLHNPRCPPFRPRHPCQSPKICLRSWPTQRRFLHRNLCRFSQSCFMMIPSFR